MLGSDVQQHSESCVEGISIIEEETTANILLEGPDAGKSNS